MYRVYWVRDTLDELARIWNAADSSGRRAITTATHQVEQLLRNQPAEQGESRPADKRILFVIPLAVLYQIDESNKTVGIGQVWRIKTHR